MNQAAVAVLIIDDSLTVRMQLSDAFKAAGFEPTACADLAQARTALSHHAYRLILLDVLLPDGDGITFLRNLKDSPDTATIPVMLLSTEAEVSDRIRGMRTGADEYVGKPYDMEFVLSRAKELVGSSETRVGVTGRTVLLMEASLELRQELKSTLEADGFHVFAVASAEEGARIVEALRPDLVIVSEDLPGTSGHQFLERLRRDSRLEGIPSLLLVTEEERGKVSRRPEGRPQAFAMKGQGVSGILAQVRELLKTEIGEGRLGPSSVLAPKRVLAVDDSSTFLNEISTALRSEGYEVMLARSGEEALDLLPLQRPDCILMDLNMLEMSGVDACRRIKQSANWRDIPVVMVTTQEDQETMIACFAAGADDFVAKSGDFDVLKARLRAQLRRRQYEEENRWMREKLVRIESELAHAEATRELAETRARLLVKEKAARERAEALEKRVKFLYEVSARIFEERLDARARMERLADLTTREIADWCIVDRFDEEGSVTESVVASRHEGLISEFLEFRKKYPETLRFGRSLVPQITDGALLSSLGNDDAVKEFRKFRLISSLEVPIQLSHQIFGRLILAISDSHRIFDVEDLRVVEEIAHRSAVALQNVKLYTDAQQSIRARDEFLAIASHELKTPLTSSLLKLQMIDRSMNPEAPPQKKLEPGKMHQMVGDCLGQVKYLGDLIDDLLDLTRVRLGRLELHREKVDLPALAREIAGRFEQDLKRSGVPLKLEIIGNAIGDWDRKRIAQIITNLVSNAIKYGQGKQIEVTVEGQDGTENARISVRDQGMGIDPKEQQRIFQLFERAVSSRNVSGLGLGLYIVKQVVEAHGGKIDVISQPGAGSVFVVDLPLRAPGALREAS